MKIVVDIPTEELKKYQKLFADEIGCPDTKTGTEAMRYILDGEFLIEKGE